VVRLFVGVRYAHRQPTGWIFGKLDILKVVAGGDGGANVSNDNIRNTSRLVVSERTPTINYRNSFWFWIWLPLSCASFSFFLYHFLR
jgi:hypothetical protein